MIIENEGALRSDFEEIPRPMTEEDTDNSEKRSIGDGKSSF
jgi:hypothetical protein